VRIRWVRLKREAFGRLLVNRCVSLVHYRLVTTDDDSSDEFTAARNTGHPIVATVTGIGRLAAVLWLMMFKPF
jgi:hypothetical protein